MKLQQLFEQRIPRDDKARQALLKQLIDSGKEVRVQSAKYVLGKFSLGDVEAIGYGEFVDRRRGKFFEQFFKYWGPMHLIVVTDVSDITSGAYLSRGDILEPGGQTEPVAVEYD